MKTSNFTYHYYYSSGLVASGYEIYSVANIAEAATWIKMTWGNVATVEIETPEFAVLSIVLFSGNYALCLILSQNEHGQPK